VPVQLKCNESLGTLAIARYCPWRGKEFGGRLVHTWSKGSKLRMLTALTRTGRLVSARLLALAYLFCVLAPAVSFAFAGAAHAAPCLTKDEHGRGIVHQHAAGFSERIHSDGHSRYHLTVVKAAEHAAAMAQPISPAGDHHKSAGGQCCGMVCVSALPTTLTDVVRPDTPRSICVSANYRAIADNTPPQHYRPPIA